MKKTSIDFCLSSLFNASLIFLLNSSSLSAKLDFLSSSKIFFESFFLESCLPSNFCDFNLFSILCIEL